jgi:hypothetical protein
MVNSSIVRTWTSVAHLNAPTYLQQRHGLPEGLLANIAAAEALAAQVSRPRT